nr:casparian strip membrane protein 2-like [Ipomoea batatas]
MKADGATEGSGGEASRGARGISIMDLILRVVAIVGSLGSAVAMGTTDQTLPFIIQSFRFEAQYDDFDTFKSIYVALTCIVETFDLWKMMMGLLTAGSSAAGIVYLAHNGNSSANWPANMPTISRLLQENFCLFNWIFRRHCYASSVWFCCQPLPYTEAIRLLKFYSLKTKGRILWRALKSLVESEEMREKKIKSYQK